MLPGLELLLPDNLVANLFAVPDRTLVWSVGGKDVGMALVREQDVESHAGGTQFIERDRRWFGLARPGTAKVELVFADGTSTTSPAVNDICRLFAGSHQHDGDICLEGFQVVGYDVSVREIWRDPHPAQKPLTVTTAPS
ncbi:hypothetical protein GCM10022419_025890 [Nonomuraea rosea]|uniref:Uncharacterized protein n=1 Tax=Nonomuraea rosea TaxID=638574 RepID=A0ABP6W0M9_9ACTN